MSLKTILYYKNGAKHIQQLERKKKHNTTQQNKQTNKTESQTKKMQFFYFSEILQYCYRSGENRKFLKFV